MSSKKKKSKSNSSYSVMGAFIFATIIYWIFHNRWNPVEFNPWGYWNLVPEQGFLETFKIFVPLALTIPFIAAQLTWFSELSLLKMAYAIRRPSLILATLRGLYAGVMEEITFRGVLIYTSMIGIVLFNKFFVIVVALSLLIIALGAATLLKRMWMKVLVWIASAGTFLWIVFDSGIDPIYALYEKFYIPAYRWILSNENFPQVVGFLLTLWVVEAVIVALAMLWLRSGKFISESTRIFLAISGLDDLISIRQYLQIIGISGAIYGITLWTIWLTDPDVVLNGPFLMTASIASLVLGFGRAHGNQGLSALWKHMAFAFYMQYVAFTYGLMYAIAVHASYDIVYLVVIAAIVRFRMRNVSTDPLDLLFSALR